MTEKKHYSAWLCDLDGTLYRLWPARLLMAGETLVFGRDVLPTIQRFRSEHERLRSENLQVPSPYALQVERTALGLGLETSVVDVAVTEWMQHRPGKWLRLLRRRSLLAEIAAYRATGGRTALVSDYPATLKLQALGARSLFDVVVANGESGGPRRLKPDPEGYLLAARQLGIDPSSCLVIGDRRDADGVAADAAGMGFRFVRWSAL